MLPTNYDLPLSELRRTKAQVDLVRLRSHRLHRFRDQLRLMDCGAAVLLDPVNVRYATGSRNMQVFVLRNPARYVFIPLDGPVVLFEFPNCEHLSESIETIDEVREALPVSYVASGPSLDQTARQWAQELADLVRQHCGDNRRLAVDRVHPVCVPALTRAGLEVADAQRPVELARSIKSPEEIECIRLSVGAAEVGMARMREALRPGRTENELWSMLHQANIALGGEYIETRLLSSGHRTNPWFQECSDKEIREGELVAFDTDVNGIFGYYADVSRTLHCGTSTPTGEQRRLYQTAFEQLHYNIQQLRTGMTFREYAEKTWPIPDEFFGNRYFVAAHGTGLSGEYPYIVHPQDFDEKGYDGVVEENMVLCVESYIGSAAGGEGVKLEEQVLLGPDGPELISTFPFEDKLL